MLLIQYGTVLDPYTETCKKLDILIDDAGIIHRIAPTIPANYIEDVYDASGCMISPGLVDVHVHFRDPGQTEKEDIYTGAAAAEAGGYTTVVCMANTRPTCDNLETLQYDKARHVMIHVLQDCAVTKGLGGKELVDFEALHEAGAPGFTDDGVNLTSGKLCLEAMRRAKALGVPLSFHEEDPAYVLSPGVNYGSKAAKKFDVLGAMPSSEEEMIARDIELALMTGARVAFQHISSAKSVALIRAGKARGADVHAEATPHHLALTQDDVLTYGVNARMNPPLRTEQDRQALIAGLADGTIDMIATDHAPHSQEEKSRGLEKSAFGIVGIETAFPLLYTYLVETGKMPLEMLIDRMADAPRRRFRIDSGMQVGDKAAVTVFDLHAQEKIDPNTFLSKGHATPFEGWEVHAVCRLTVCGDKIAYNALSRKE